jgi:hypothetical protein
MPSPEPSRTISRRDFPGKLKRNSPELPAKARCLVELMMFGESTGATPLTMLEAAAVLKIGKRTTRKYFGHPRARQYYDALFAEMRETERPRSFHAARSVRDDQAMAKSAAGNRARIAAMEFMEDRNNGLSVSVNVGVGVGVSLQPGYVLGIDDSHMVSARELLERAHSTRSLVHEERDSPAREIEHDDTETALPPTRAPAASPESAFGHRPFEEFPPRDSRRRNLSKRVDAVED